MAGAVGIDEGAVAARRLLEGVRVLDLTMHLSGPYGSMLLADMGAEVIKVEPPHGDPQRLLDPRRGDVPLIWASINRNKRSVVIDLQNPAGRDVFLQLVRDADVVINNYRPGVLDRLGLGYEALTAANPRIVLGNLTGFGLSGPRASSPAYDIAIQALSGGMSLTGYPDSPPARAGVPIGDLAGGMFLALAVVSALRHRDATGEPVNLDISLLDSSVSLLMYWAALALNAGVTPPPQGSGNSQVYPYGAYPTSDGWVIVAPYSGTFWPKLCEAIGRTDLLVDERFGDNNARVANREVLEEMLFDEFRRRTSSEWVAILEAADVPASPVNSVIDAMLDPQVEARGMRVQIPIDGEVLSFAGNPIKLVPDRPATASAPPRFGEHTRDVLAEAGIPSELIDELADAGVLRVEDIHGQAWAGKVRGGRDSV